MSKNGNSILNFVYNNFGFLSDVVRVINKDGDNYISREQLHSIAKEDTNIERLLSLKIAREVDGVYELDKRVLSFISFSHNEFALSSPESVKKYHYSLNKLYDKLLSSLEDNDIIRHGDQLISELRDFSDILEENITRLLQETLDLKENLENKSPVEQFDRASAIIKEYIEPLNEIVEDREDAILFLVRNIISLALKKSDTLDRNIASKMRRLWLQARAVHENTESFGMQIIGELFTLKKIKKTSSVVVGAIGWLENMDDLNVRGICDKYTSGVHSAEFFFDAIELLESILEENVEVLVPTAEELRASFDPSTYHHFDSALYLTRLREDMPVMNIFKWLYLEMQKKDELSYTNYCVALSLLDSLSLSSTKQREIIRFDTCSLDIPISEVKNIITDKGTK